MKRNMIVLDCGNPPCGVILGVYDGEQITTEVTSRIPNYMVRIHQYFYWGILMIRRKLLEGLKKVVKRAGTIHSIGTCTQRVNSVLSGKQGLMIQNPSSYRNGIGAEVLEQMFEEQRTCLFEQTGILCGKINSVNMIKGMMEKVQSIVFCDYKLLMIPDILNYLLTGCMVNEPSELSTTQLMDVRRREPSEGVLRTMEIPSDLFAAIGKYGMAIGILHSNIRETLGISYNVPVICVPSHDTTAVVLTIPAEEDEFLSISTGIWALIGMELEELTVNEEVRKRCLTNEIEAFNKITLLRNSVGMSIIQRIEEEYEREHGNIGWEELNSPSDHHEGIVPPFPVNDTSFFNPVHMSDEIWSYFVKTGQVSGEKDWGAIIYGFQNSMVLSFASVIQDLEEISGKKKDTVYIAGGGSRNARSRQMTADAVGKGVAAGGKESTSLGNLGAQLKYFEPDLTVRETRGLLGKGIESIIYCRGKSSGEALKRYQKLEGQGGLSMDGRMLRMCGINKSFFGVPVLKNAQSEAFPGEVHVLLGENGADKSTLTKVLSGAYGREGKDIQLDGRELAPMTPKEALDAGVSVIHREFNLVPDLPVYESTLIGKEYGQEVLVDHKRVIKEAKGHVRRVGLEVSLRTLVCELSVAQKQLVEMTKAIPNHVKILVLGKPTAAITDRETNMLSGIIRELQKEKIGIIYIPHRMSEPFEIGDRCMVVRDGGYIGTVRLFEFSGDELTKMVTGRMVSLEKIANEAADTDQVMLKVENLRYKDFLKDISFEPYKGEILGFAGLVGAGRTEAAKYVIGAYRKNGGTVTYKGETLSNSPSRNIEKGIVCLSEDRKGEGLVLVHFAMDNIALPNLKRLAKPSICKKEMADRAEDYIKSLQIKTHIHLTEARNLPGGNQREVVIAKWLYSNADAYISDEPIRGIDAGVRDEIHNIMYDLVNQGTSIIMMSFDSMEVLKMYDRVVVMREGVLEAILDNDLDLTQETTLKCATQGGIQV